MKIVHSALIASGILFCGQALAAEPQSTPESVQGTSMQAPAQKAGALAPEVQANPVQLSLAELDRVTAGALGLPNDKVIFSGFDNAAPGDFHPNFDRSSTGFDASGNEGPWSAAFNSPAIEFCVC